MSTWQVDIRGMDNIKKNFKWFLVLGLFLGVAFTWYAVFAEERSGLTVVFLDVGQGDAIYIEGMNGNQVLIDGGPNKEVLRQLSRVMPFYDRSIDVIIESHPDADHISGLVDVLERYDVGLVMESGVGSDSAVYAELENVRNQKGIQKILVRRGQIIDLGEGVFLEILFPDRDVSGLETNLASVVCRLVYGETEFLFTGDSPKAMESYLISVYGKELQSDVLKTGHHGSKTSTSEMFLGYVGPEYVVISSGKDNKYGHPSGEVLDILKKFGAEIFRTDEKGAIKMQSDGESITVAR